MGPTFKASCVANLPMAAWNGSGQRVAGTQLSIDLEFVPSWLSRPYITDETIQVFLVTRK
jgi:hypothetical protein